MATLLTPQTVNVLDRVTTVSKCVLPHMVLPMLDFTLSPGSLGTVIDVDRDQWVVIVEWDDAPMLPAGKRQTGAHPYMPSEFEDGWSLRKVGVRFLKGRLYLRLHDGAPWSLFYPKIDVPDDYSRFDLMEVATMRLGFSEPAFGGYLETTHHGERVDFGYFVEFRAATDDDLRQVFETWGTSKSYSIEEWLRNIQVPPVELHEDELARLNHLASEFLSAEQ